MAQIPVTFNEGAPLDPDELNKLNLNIKDLASNQSLLNTTIEGVNNQVTSSFTDCGRIPVSFSSTLNKWGNPTNVTVSSSFSKNSAISVTCNSKLNDGEIVTFYTTQVDNGSFQIFAQSNKRTSQAFVHYIIVDKKVVSS